MAINILEAARLAANNGEYKKAGVLMTFAQRSPLLQAASTVPIPGNSYAWTRQSVLPSIGFRGVNEAYAESAGKTEKRTEALKIIGGDLDVDRFVVQTGGESMRTEHELMKATALAQSIGAALVRGAVVTGGGATGDAESFDGLMTRYGGGFSTTAVATDGPNGGQIVTNNGASDALSMAKLDEAIMKVDNPTHLLMPKKMRININALLRNSAALSITKDAFGMPVLNYGGLPILDADINGDTAAIGFNENNDSTCSIYVLSMTPGGFHLIENGGIQVRDLGEQNSKPVFRTRVEWYVGMVDEHPRCVSRLFNIADLAAVA